MRVRVLAALSLALPAAVVAAATSTTAAAATVAGKARRTPSPPSRQALHYTAYTNARFGFTVDVPRGFTASQQAPDGASVTFRDSRGSTTQTVYGERSAGESPRQALNQLVAICRAEHENVTYTAAVGHVVAVSGTVGRHDIFYLREIVRRHVIDGMSWQYPASEAALMNRAVTHTAHSFTVGPD